ncbi:signal peptidase I [Amycolatopsis arida]|uniref:Signal peptidase I n=1 Tax=Amycolatopsis arida TaxID=587909 RepID=A0A1I5YHE6_9PSEU|nr:signal peptidase I [Amycolatopsis arida]TDX90518.1 signal peptidase I [Amycolatopsis arida]SFQ43642.1 signal peptidase I [Amycolatopsis arida]
MSERVSEPSDAVWRSPRSADEIPSRRRRGRRVVLAVLAVLAVGGAAATAFGVVAWIQYDRYQTGDSSGMGQVLAGTTVVTRPIEDGEPRRGDVIVFRNRAWLGPTSPEPMLSRVVGLGGDTVACCDPRGRITVNGQPVTEEYLDHEFADMSGHDSFEYEAAVPDGHVFVLGDQRANAVDSRMYVELPSAGGIPYPDVLGVAVATSDDGFVAEPLEPTTAFTDAGLPGPATRDATYFAKQLLLLIGALVFAASLVTLLLVGVDIRHHRDQPPPPVWS